jgi:UDP-N-acetylmuramate dehydrogenase
MSLKRCESMALHCSLRAGGLSQFFFMPNSIQTLVDFLKSNTKPILFIGLGSNLLIRDTGFQGVIIKLTQLKLFTLDGSNMNAAAGLALAKIARIASKNHLYGAEFLSAIPGTLGGALAMNAGAFGHEIWSLVERVRTINSVGEVFYRYPKDFEIGYRQVIPTHANEYFIGAELKFKTEKNQQNIQQLLEIRKTSQPIGLPSCGSVFKNPAPYYAAKLIEQSGLKGFCIGGACVSNKHANFIINQNNASASDIENLILHIQQTVKSNVNIDLELELKII